MKERFVFPALVLTGLAGTLFAGELVEKIVARANDRLITNPEFQKRLETASHAPQPVADKSGLKKDVLDDLIKEKLIEERAKDLPGSGATDAEVEEPVERVKRQYNLATDA